MYEALQTILHAAGGGAEFMMLATVFAGIMMAVVGACGLLAPADPIERRLARGKERHVSAAPLNLRRGESSLSAGGLKRFIAPVDPRERRQVEQQLVRAGFRGDQAFITYYFIRAALGFLLPLPLAWLARLVRDH